MTNNQAFSHIKILTASGNDAGFNNMQTTPNLANSVLSPIIQHAVVDL